MKRENFPKVQALLKELEKTEKTFGALQSHQFQFVISPYGSTQKLSFDVDAPSDGQDLEISSVKNSAELQMEAISRTYIENLRDFCQAHITNLEKQLEEL